MGGKMSPKFIQDPNNPRRRIEIPDNAPSPRVSEPSRPTTYNPPSHKLRNTIIVLAVIAVLAAIIIPITVSFTRTHTITLNPMGGSGGTASVEVRRNSEMPSATAPTREGHTFQGFFDGNGVQYYTATMESARNWSRRSSTTLYASWAVRQFTITFNSNGGSSVASITRDFGSSVARPTNPTRTGGHFIGWYTTSALTTPVTWPHTMGGSNTTFFARWFLGTASPTSHTGINNNNTRTSTITASGGSGNYTFAIVSTNHPNANVSLSGTGTTQRTLNITRASSQNNSGTVRVRITDTTLNVSVEVTVSYSTGTTPCLVPGTLVTLADGSQMPVETLNGDELLLVWNFYTGEFDFAPITLLNTYKYEEYEIIHMKFSNNAYVRVGGDHTFWNFTLNKFVRVNSETVTDMIGHYFKQHILDDYGNLIWHKIRLLEVDIYYEYTTLYSPATFGHFSLYVNGILSAPGGRTEIFFTIFEVNSDAMTYCWDLYYMDIEEFGLLSIEEFREFIPEFPEMLFLAFNGKYLNIAVGKGITTWEEVFYFINRYAESLGLA